MKKLKIDFDEIQKAAEDTERNAFDYFLDTETGDVIVLSQDIIVRAEQTLEEAYDEDMADFDEVHFDEVTEIPDWMEDEVELALNIFLHDKDRYERIPERIHSNGYSAMKEFSDTIENLQLKEHLLAILDGKGAFRRFKDALEPYPKERKKWYGFNAAFAKKDIEKWLKTIGVEAE
ncbi:MAG: hypothetical protein A2X59_02910 [Nitrospirae bacterium GWC2_42_7]|nr:MAG: hypothetical protein A2X59_02910 [Nitrospirae bacterium GWC2_42_7]